MRGGVRHRRDRHAADEDHAEERQHGGVPEPHQEEVAAAARLVAPDVAQRLAQHLHPAEAGEQQRDQADDPDRRLGLGDLLDLQLVREPGKLRVDRPDEVVAGLRADPDEVAEQRVRERQQREERQERVAGERGGEPVAAPLLVPLERADLVVEPGPALAGAPQQALPLAEQRLDPPLRPVDDLPHVRNVPTPHRPMRHSVTTGSTQRIRRGRERPRIGVSRGRGRRRRRRRSRSGGAICRRGRARRGRSPTPGSRRCSSRVP